MSRQHIIVKWGKRCFGKDQMADRLYRGLRFIEEALELCQALGLSKEKVLAVVEHVYSRPVGKVEQELGGVGVTWMTVAEACGVNAMACLDKEIYRVLQKTPEHFAERNQQKNDAGLKP